MIDNRSKKFIFVPFCLMAQAYQAQGIVLNMIGREQLNQSCNY